MRPDNSVERALSNVAPASRPFSNFPEAVVLSAGFLIFDQQVSE